mmetsp:Transcript_5557/g.6955  ORF Transcript_5557/g.6955 Transcript_5557/m.6955 type:complete len:209 (+) Transcript_5557:53-679(+)
MSAMNNPIMLWPITLIIFLLSTTPAAALNILIPGGTGQLGRLLSSSLPQHTVTILCRNSFLASAPSRVSGDFGWLGRSFLEKNENVALRDWDGGDLLDIVGCDWVGWQDDSLKGADVVVNLVGGFTEQRVMATERIVRESLRLNPTALQIAVSPFDEDVRVFNRDRLKRCEEMIEANCINHACLRFGLYDLEGSCEGILNAIEKNTQK